MFKVMVVEDEPPILNSICKLLSFYEKKLQVVHTAINGRRALEYLEENPVDIIFTDIKMPVMNGLELAREVSLAYPDTLVVIVSGFSEFEFARTAIQYGVKDYLLKPISKDSLDEVVEKCMENLQLIEKKRLKIILRRAALGERPEIDVDPACHYGMLLYCEGAFPVAPDELPRQSRLLWDVAAVEQELESWKTQDDIVAVVLGRSFVEKLVLFTADDSGAVVETSKKLFDFLIGQSKIPVTMLVLDKTVTIEQALKQLPFLRAELYDRTCIFQPSFMVGAEQCAQQDFDFSPWRMDMVCALKAGSNSEISRLANSLVDILVQKPMRQKRLEVLLEKVILNSVVEGGTLKQTEDLKKEIQLLISTADVPEFFAAALSELLTTWAEDGLENEEAEFSESVAAWLRLNHKKNINSATLVAHFNVPAAKISRQFKNNFGVSFSEYVNQFRIGLAQTMMHERPKARIKEIAIDVGFSDQYYFSKMFKKITGFWPTEYMSK